MISCLNEIFVVLIFVQIFYLQFLFCLILERKDDKSFKRDIIALISFPILFVSTSFLVNFGKQMSLPGFRMFTSFSNCIFLIGYVLQGMNLFLNKCMITLVTQRQPT